MVLAHNIEEGNRTQDVKISDDVTFATMLLTNNTLEGLSKSGFFKPSPIQLHGIPLGKCGFDLLLEAKSGTGKTAVFTVIALEKLDISKGLQVVILAPTREIAAQICNVTKLIGSGYKNLSVEVVMGGLPIQDDIEKFKKNTHIIVGSPGRLRHLIQDKHIDISAVRLLVLDEADKLMDKSFLADINYIFSTLPKQKQVIMSSATYPESLKSVIAKYVQNVQHICPDSTSILLGIKQLFTVVKSNSNIVKQTQYRFEELLKVLSKKQFKQCLIFCNYQVRVGEVCKMLMQQKWPAEQLHGQQEQTERLEALKTLQEYKCRILVSTDLAARGIDASNIDLVINFEPPFEWQTYLHRIGRAGRFGSYGAAITILSERQEQLKFKNMLEAINVSLDLRNLWDNVQFHLENSTAGENYKTPQSILDKPIETINEDIDLWDILTQKNDKTTEVVNFEEFNNSFNHSEKYQVHSFDDLLASFDAHQNSDENSLYKHVEYTKISNCKTPPSITNNLIAFTDLDDGMEKMDKSSNHVDTNKQVMKQHPKMTTNENQGNIKGNLKTLIYQIENNYCNKKSTDLDINTEDMSKVLEAAGLPTSFGRNRTSKKKSDMKFATKNKNIQKSSYDKSKDKSIKNECDKVNITQIPKLGYLKGGSDASEEEIQDDDGYNTSHPCYSNWNNIEVSNKRKNNYKKNHPYTHSTEMKTNSDLAYKNYIMWYSQLKNYTKQVEMSLYVEELSRMKY